MGAGLLVIGWTDWANSVRAVPLAAVEEVASRLGIPDLQLLAIVCWPCALRSCFRSMIHVFGTEYTMGVLAEGNDEGDDKET